MAIASTTTTLIAHIACNTENATYDVRVASNAYTENAAKVLHVTSKAHTKDAA